MMAETIAFVLRNLPVFLLVAALALAAVRRTGASGPERLLGWILLLPIGVTGLWAAVFHLFFPKSRRPTLAGRSVRSSPRWGWRIWRLARRLA
jgi:hypothetical protein